jgi:hypothetical protein
MAKRTSNPFKSFEMPALQRNEAISEGLGLAFLHQQCKLSESTAHDPHCHQEASVDVIE